MFKELLFKGFLSCKVFEEVFFYIGFKISDGVLDIMLYYAFGFYYVEIEPNKEVVV